MSPGPLRRLVGSLGLLALAPLALLLLVGRLTPTVAAQRSVVVLVVVLGVGHLLQSYLRRVAARFSPRPRGDVASLLAQLRERGDAPDVRTAAGPAPDA